jgi:hypothetical protein
MENYLLAKEDAYGMTILGMTNNLIVSAQTSVIVRHEAISSYGIQILV